MNIWLFRAAAMVAVLQLAGCATVGIADGTEPEIEVGDRLPGYSPDGVASLEVTRVSRLGGMACAVTLAVDGKPIANLASGRRVKFGVDTGRLLLTAHFARNGPCPATVSTLELQVNPGEVARVVYDISHHGQHILLRAN